MQLKHYFHLVKRWSWLIILGALLGGGISFGVSYFQVPVYQTSALVFISQPPREQLYDLGYLSGQQLILTYAQLLVTDPIIESSSQRLEYNISAGRIRVQQIRDTQILEVIVEDSYPYWAATVANTLIEVFIEHQYQSQTSRYAASKESLAANLEEQRQLVETTSGILESLRRASGESSDRDRLEDDLRQYRETYAGLLKSYEDLRIAEAQSAPNIELVQPAKVPTVPIRPRIVSSSLLGAVVGLMFAGAIIFLIEYLDDTVKSPEDLVRELKIPVVGTILAMRPSGNSAKREIYVAGQPRSPISEAFRSLRANLEFAGVDKPLKSLLITSPGPGEGKTTVAANLAIVIAQGGKRV
ncbi:MAG: Wzz/FepE/Etk N-terminal domain-containing protein, partial [Anaerolineae bacterium]|nr:Wzz/FepE/Etk N-terminal domain-containing protein [Anaerolineae bacterium]